jgi:hypothetical protein
MAQKIQSRAFNRLHYGDDLDIRRDELNDLDRYEAIDRREPTPPMETDDI